MNSAEQKYRILRHASRKPRLATTLKRQALRLFLVLVLVAPILYTRVGAPARVYAAASNNLNFQARLLTGSGAIVPDGNYSVQFNLYNVASAGTTQWTETQASVAVRAGYLSVYLGSVTPFPSTIDWSQQQWLTMNVNGDGEMTPRLKLTAVPNALHANEADALRSGSNLLTADNLAQLAPTSPQVINSALAALRLNQTGAGLLAQLQYNGSDVFTIANNGDLTSSGSATFSGGTLTVGSATQAGGLVLNDGSNHTLRLQAGSQAANLTFTLPSAYGSSGDCIKGNGSGTLSFGACAGANSFVNGGNAFSGLAVLGTTDSNNLQIITANTQAILIDASGNVKIGSSGSATEKLDVNGGIRLGNSTGSNAGTIRWNGVDFEGYNGSNWVSLTAGSTGPGSGLATKVKTADQIVNNSAALQNDSTLFFSIAASEKISFRFVVQGISSAQANIQFAVTAPSGATCIVGVLGVGSGSGNAGCGAGISVSGTGADSVYEITGSVINGATAGNVQLLWAQGTARSFNTTVYKGSYLQYTSNSSTGSGTTLQNAYDASSAPAVVTTTDAKNLGVTLADTATDSNFLVNIASGSTGKFAVQSNGTDVLHVTSAGTVIDSGGLTVSTGGASITGTVTLASLNSSGVVHTNGSGQLSTGAVVLGTDTSGSYVANLGPLTGLSVTGNSGSGSTPALSVLYGSTTNTAVQGNTTLVCASGTGNLTGGGSTITLGSGGNCGTIGTNAAVSFATSVTTPLLTNAGGLMISTTGANDLTLTSGSGLLFLNASTIRRVAAGTTMFDLQDGSNTTFALGNSGLGVVNLTVDGSGQFGTGLTVVNGGAAITGNTSVTSGTFTASGGLVSLNNASNFGTSINTGSSTGTITLGGGSAPLVIDSTAFDVTVGGNISTPGTYNTNTFNGTTLTFGGASGTISTTSNGNLTLGPNGSGVLALNTGTGGILTTNAGTIQRSGATGLTLDLANAGTTTLTVTNSDASNVANLSVEGGISSGGGNFSVNVTGDVTGQAQLLDGSSTANGASAGGLGSSTSLTLVSAANFDIGNYVQVTSANCGGTGINPCYAKITAKATNTLTISPALTWANAAVVKEYHIPEIGGTDTSQTLANRYGRGYFISGVATGNGTTYYNEDSVTSSLANFDFLSGVTGTLSIGVGANKITLGGGGTTTTFAGTVSFTGTVSGIGPSTGTSGYLQRNGTTISPATAGDSFTTSGSISTSGTGTITAANGLTVQGGGASITGGLTLATGALNLTSGGITNAGSIAGATTISASGAITAATTTNTINGLIINSGALSGISTISASGAITAATTTNTINGLVINAGALSGVSTVNASGLITSVGLTAGAGLIQNTGGLTSTGSISLNANATTNTTNIGTGTTSGQIKIGGGSAPLVIDSTAFDVSATGALSGITTISASGAITAATTTNTINGLIISSGALSSVTGITFSSGGLNLANGGITNGGAFSGITTLGLSGAITGATTTNTINGLIINSGALSGVSGITFTSGSLNIANGGIINAGAVAGVTTLTASNQIYVPGTSGSLAQGFFTGSSTTPLGAFQSLDLGGNTYSFLATNKYYNSGTGWTDNGQGRLGSSFQMQNDSFTFYSFDAGNTFTPRFTVASGGNVGIGLSGAPAGLLSVGGTTGNFQVNSAGGFTGTSGLVQVTGTGSALILDRTDGVIGSLKSGSAKVAFFYDNTGSFSISKDTRANIASGTGAGTDVLTALASGNVGIGDTNPLAQFTVGTGSPFQVSSTGAITGVGLNAGSGLIQNTGGITTTGTLSFNTNAGTNTTSIATGTTSGQVTIGGGSAPLVIDSTNFDVSATGALSGITTITTSGNINTTAGVYQVGGTAGLTIAACTAGQYIGNGVATKGGIITAGSCRSDATGLSDVRLKKDITSVGSVLDKLEDVRVVTFDFKVDEFPDLNLDQGLQYGVIAQELEQIFPELVSTRDDGYKEVNFKGLSFYTLKAVTELAAKVNAISPGAGSNEVVTDGVLRLSHDGVLQNITGFNIISGGATIAGGINNSGGGITNAGAVLGATTISGQGLVLNANSDGNLLTLSKDGKGVFTVFNNGALGLQTDATNAFGVKNAAGVSIFAIDTQNGKVMLGSGDTAKTVLFILDSRSTVDDPAGTNGASYYNAAAGRFRCYQDDRWQDCLPAGDLTTSIASDKVTWHQPAEDTEFPDTPRVTTSLNRAHEFRLNIRVTEAAATGATCRLQYATNDNGPWSDLMASGTNELAIDKTGTLKTAWVKIADGARTSPDTIIRVMCQGGNTAQTPVIYGVSVQIR